MRDGVKIFILYFGWLGDIFGRTTGVLLKIPTFETWIQEKGYGDLWERRSNKRKTKKRDPDVQPGKDDVPGSDDSPDNNSPGDAGDGRPKIIRVSELK